MQREISKLVPEARIIIAHGQMNEEELEDAIISFINGDAEILLCTTIIETGIDMPNVNTLIVYDADRMGLSQLYQLRGRVGRSNRIAYAYFTYKRIKFFLRLQKKA
ncbi:helicase-related protein [Caloramator sp. Dgby_cultured_2]|uniref:helicase-related protein n=1 Tax=Caloramator sp. Dgby_cultured_2 TaxID=3029174 RepID=UPI0031593DE7